MQIQLTDCSFFGFHGMHEEEKKIVNKDIDNSSVGDNESINNIDETNEAIYDYVCNFDDSQYDDIDEYLQPIIPRHVEQEQRIHDLENKLSATQELIYQLLGGLFNHDSQSNILEAYSEFLYTGKWDSVSKLEKNQYPTTRQGDTNEKRIQKLEETVDVLVDKAIDNLERRQKRKPLRRKYSSRL